MCVCILERDGVRETDKVSQAVSQAETENPAEGHRVQWSLREIYRPETQK